MSACAARSLLLLLALSLLPACGPMTFTVGGSPRDNRLRTTVVDRDGGFSSNRVAIIDVSGLIVNAEKPALLRQGENPVSLLQERLDEAASDRRVKAVILRLNTPGGTVTASDAMYREVVRFRERTGKPVIALMMDVAASGGYYVACAADEIVAYPTSVTGSIGVIVQTLSVKPALGKLGIEAEALTSGRNKEAGSPLAHMTPDHRAVLRGLVDDFYAQFVAVVRDNRPGIPADRFDDVTDGRVMSGVAAAEAGLVDRTGDLHDAFALAKRRAGIERAHLVIYHRPLDYVGSPYAHGSAAAPGAGSVQVNLAQINLPDLLGAEAPGFYYLWRGD